MTDNPKLDRVFGYQLPHLFTQGLVFVAKDRERASISTNIYTARLYGRVYSTDISPWRLRYSHMIETNIEVGHEIAASKLRCD